MEKLNEMNNAWRKMEINIAITGESGSGKSSFINALRNMKAGDEGAAEIGATETTTEPKAYSFKDSENVKIWDLPGVGTPKFPKETYLEKIDIESYDFIMLVSCSRYKENDKWLANEITRRYQNQIFFSYVPK
ncbi:hypothetical protein DPMN_013035 [Dreissena polymorpha]|uniref:IRG-type G domain-containing protein n=1 Tax=Dreissena polymorpha TaxID=45954 RepID=A0A9D4S1H0_DREPO|nr:hypothetical protein DPMN_013035 [Dreissena polymorpha]